MAHAVNRARRNVAYFSLASLWLSTWKKRTRRLTPTYPTTGEGTPFPCRRFLGEVRHVSSSPSASDCVLTSRCSDDRGHFVLYCECLLTFMAGRRGAATSTADKQMEIGGPVWIKVDLWGKLGKWVNHLYSVLIINQLCVSKISQFQVHL